MSIGRQESTECFGNSQVWQQQEHSADQLEFHMVLNAWFRLAIDAVGLKLDTRIKELILQGEQALVV